MVDDLFEGEAFVACDLFCFECEVVADRQGGSHLSIMMLVEGKSRRGAVWVGRGVVVCGRRWCIWIR